MEDLISVADAQRRILERIEPVESERVPVERAAGRVLAEPALATVDLPPFPSSAMDGYAVRAADTAGAPTDLTVVARVPAGSPASRSLGAGEAIAISTGGVVPEGADAVVPVELTKETESELRVLEAVSPGANVRSQGSDVEAGARVLGPGSRIGPAQVGALAAAGLAEVRCTKRPRAGILTTGSELQQTGEPLGPGQIYESNGVLLATMCQSAGAVPAQLGVVADEADVLEREMERALLGFDMLITSGGASVGPHDLVRSTFPRLRIEEIFWGVAMKPGKPVSFGMRRDHPVFVLPGNPVSVLVSFEVLVRPAINALLGVPEPLPVYRRGALAAPLRRSPTREEFVRARTTVSKGAVSLEPLVGQESHMIARTARADALVAVRPGNGELPSGAEVDYLALT